MHAAKSDAGLYRKIHNRPCFVWKHPHPYNLCGKVRYLSHRFQKVFKMHPPHKIVLKVQYIVSPLMATHIRIDLG